MKQDEMTAAFEKIADTAIGNAINKTLAFLRNNGGIHNFESWADFESRYREWMSGANKN